MSDADLPFLYLTTIGWKTGNLHEIEIWFVQHNSRYYLVSERLERSHWIQNIQRDQRVAFRVGEQYFEGTGRIVDPVKQPQLSARISALMEDKYGWSEGLIAELTPA